MINIAHETNQAKSKLLAAGSEANAQVERLKAQASQALASPYVRAGAAIGVAAAGYAYFKRRKAAPRVTPAEKRQDPVDFLKVGSLLLSMVTSVMSASERPAAEAAAASARAAAAASAIVRKPEPEPEVPAAPPAASDSRPLPSIPNPSAGWAGRQWQILKAAAMAWIDDFAPSMGAALSYYTLFSLAPLLVIVIAIAGLVFGQDAAQGAIIAQLGGIMGKEGATAVQGLLKAAREPSTGIVASIIGGLLLLLGATAIFAELQSDLDRIWRAPAKNKQSGLWSWLRGRVLSFGLILGLAFMLMVSLVVSAALAASSAWLGGGAAESVIANVLNFAASLAIFTVLFAMIYKIMPNVKISWRDVWTGAAVTALLFNVGKSLIGLYLAKSNVASGFGAAGSFVILVAWFYYSAQIFLFGAEYTWVYANSKTPRALGQARP